MLQNTQFEASNPPSATIRTSPHIKTTYTQLFSNKPNISSNTSNIATYNTLHPSRIPQSTVSHPTYMDTSTSISEPIKPFEGLDQKIHQKNTFNILRNGLHFH